MSSVSKSPGLRRPEESRENLSNSHRSVRNNWLRHRLPCGAIVLLDLHTGCRLCVGQSGDHTAVANVQEASAGLAASSAQIRWIWLDLPAKYWTVQQPLPIRRRRRRLIHRAKIIVLFCKFRKRNKHKFAFLTTRNWYSQVCFQIKGKPTCQWSPKQFKPKRVLQSKRSKESLNWNYQVYFQTKSKTGIHWPATSRTI